MTTERWMVAANKSAKELADYKAQVHSNREDRRLAAFEKLCQSMAVTTESITRLLMAYEKVL